MLRLHLVGLPHTQTSKAYSWCAYSSKVRNFANMMSSLGHEVLVYAGEENEAACDRLVTCITPEEQAEHFGVDIPTFSVEHPGFVLFADRAIKAIEETKQPGDYLCIIGGQSQKPIADAHPDLTCVEFGIGYGGVFAPFRVYESYAWMHTVMGALHGAHTADGRFFDAVIPNSFELEDFPLGDASGNYLLYMGRLIERKGIEVVAEIQKRTGKKLVIAGEGEHFPDCEYTYAGVVGPQERMRLMGGAIATLVPTLYLEPFGGVAVESQLCGTPVVTTDWGAFPETVRHGVTGYRCHTLAEFCEAVEDAPGLHRELIRDLAKRYTTDNVKYDYQTYFDRLETLKGAGWYAESRVLEGVA